MQLHHIHLKAPDPSTTAQWYVELFGAAVQGEDRSGGRFTITLDLHGTRLNISTGFAGEEMGPGDATPHYGLEHFALTTPNIEELYARLQEKGVEILQPLYVAPYHGQPDKHVKVTFIKAPDEVRIELIQLPD